MGTGTKRLERRRIALGAGWIAGIGMMLVEMQWGMDYVLSHVAGQVGAIVGWLPMIATVARHFWS